MRVLHVIPAIAPRYGGPSMAIAAMCAALNRLDGLEVELATTDADGADSRIETKDIPTGFVTHLFQRTCSERWKFSFPLGSWLRHNCRTYDLIHVHGLWSYATYAAGRAAARARVPFLIRPAGMLSHYTWNRHLGARRLYWVGCERKTVRQAHAFHATSRAEAKECEWMRPHSHTFVIPNGVGAAAWEVGRDSSVLRTLCGPRAGDRPILLFLSRIHPKKGITDVLLPALAQMKSDAFLAIVGGADAHENGYLEVVRSEIDRLGLPDRLALLGPIPSDRRWQLFDGAAAFVLPSHSENFGIVVAEAMARGCPVVVSDAVQAAEHVEDAGAGLVVPVDAPSFARALSSLLDDPAVGAQFGSAGRAYARIHFCWDRIARQILEMYEKCLQTASANS